jgi:hypothetical protein
MSIILSSLINHKALRILIQILSPNTKEQMKICTCKSDSKFLHQQNYYKHNIAILNNIGKTNIGEPYVSLFCRLLLAPWCVTFWPFLPQKKRLFPTN